MSTENAAPPAAPKPTRLAPIVTLDAKFFWDAADKGEFVGEQCSDCGKLRFPPRPMCPYCHSVKREVVKLSGRGTVYSWILPQHPMPFGFKEPPIVATIELEEGEHYRLVSNLYGVSMDEVKAGMAVEVYFEPTMGNHQVPVFRPARK
jgi:uncharacterized OB-fold protein